MVAIDPREVSDLRQLLGAARRERDAAEEVNARMSGELEAALARVAELERDLAAAQDAVGLAWMGRGVTERTLPDAIRMKTAWLEQVANDLDPMGALQAVRSMACLAGLPVEPPPSLSTIAHELCLRMERSGAALNAIEKAVEGGDGAWAVHDVVEALRSALPRSGDSDVADDVELIKRPETKIQGGEATSSQSDAV